MLPEALLEPFPEAIILSLDKNLIQEEQESLRNIVEAELRAIATAHCAFKIDDRTARFRRRDTFKQMAQGLGTALAASADLNRELRFILRDPDGSLEQFRQLLDDLERWAPIFADLAAHALPSGDEANDQLFYTCIKLAMIYRRLTGKKPTMSTIIKSADTREPQSNFGRFVVVFFSFFDPDMKATYLVTPLRKAVKAESKMSND